jgi:hypothetical protein
VALAARAGASEVDRLSAHAANGARCASASGRDRAYLERYDVDVVDGAAVGSPVGRRFFEGTVLDVEARPTPDRGAVVCELRLDRSDALSIDRVPTPYGELETPSLRITRMHGSLTVPTGSTRIAVANVDGQFVTLVLLSASID